jgi:hypothetical protein
MSQLERFTRVIHAAFERDNHSFLATIAREHNAFTECWVLVTAFSSNRPAHELYGFYWSATMIARELGILPGTPADALRLFAALSDGPASGNAAIRFVKQAGDALIRLISADPSGWDAAKVADREISSCKFSDGIPNTDRAYRSYVVALEL